MITIEQWNGQTDDIEALARVLHGCVHGGASVGFVLPHPMAEARRFWRDTIQPQVTGGGRVVLFARRETQIVGTGSLVIDTPANQPHRAEVSKLLVHPDHRRQGIARALMTALEGHARTINRRLLTLDTRSGDTAEPLYVSLGFQVAGRIPGYCMDPTGARFESTTYMFKPL
ncbi:GNAT family N-acetyltransferase [Thalassovita taeanensis]|uniref:N-acetyltransferase domain-containing protein n=1 Tax=Thalassovita taeanensis TaxID=657014 RepID=A0A1H9CQY0_9RHOB|nr:GNAT family N-acetyltransferase [Thalassovita taeanensis]SEQ03018.1 hypothetical protein SAMN04488092_103336 [Thalassovita taeanensis]